MFETLSRSAQGDLGEARAIYELSRLGYNVSKPLRVHIPYDLIVEQNGVFNTVQVKTSSLVVRENTSVFQVQLATTGGNTKRHTSKPFAPSAVDWLFVMTSDDRCWFIPTCEINATSSTYVGTKLYAEYELNRTPNNPSIELVETLKVDKRTVAPPFTPEELQRQIVERPTVEVAKLYGMSDNGLARWIKKWGLLKPARGYWQKKQAGII